MLSSTIFGTAGQHLCFLGGTSTFASLWAPQLRNQQQNDRGQLETNEAIIRE